MKYALVILVTAVVTAAAALPLARRFNQPAAVEPPASTVQQLMEGMVQPNALGVFNSVGVISTLTETIERQPRTDEDWAAVDRHAAILAEAASLLKVSDRRVSDEVEPVTADSPDHPPARIEQLIRENRDGWNERADGMAAVAQRVRQAVRAKSVDGLYDGGSDLQAACEACHETFWYNAPPGTRIRR